MPGSTSTIVKRPVELVLVVREALVETSVSVTVTPPTKAPLGSAICPTIVPLDVACPHTGTTLTRQTTKRRVRTNFTLRSCIYRLLKPREIELEATAFTVHGTNCYMKVRGILRLALSFVKLFFRILLVL